jgi:hypothetical protein
MQSGSMKAFLTLPKPIGRKFAAWLCLAAVMLLWSPVWTAIWQTAQMSCCTGGTCPLHGHAKHSEHGKQTATEEAPRGCEHRGASGISQCSISCCQNQADSFVASTAFVLPGAPLLSRPPHFVARVIIYMEREILPEIAPPDHPPRLLPS